MAKKVLVVDDEKLIVKGRFKNEYEDVSDDEVESEEVFE